MDNFLVNSVILPPLNLLPLEYRKEISDLVFFFKSKVSLLLTDLRGFCALSSQDIELETMLDTNNFKLIHVHNQDYYRKSYFIRTAELYRVRTGPENPGEPWKKFLKPWKFLETPGKALEFFLLSPGKSYRTLLKK